MRAGTDAKGTSEVDFVRNYMTHCLYPKLAPHQQVLLVPGTFLSSLPKGKVSASANWTQTDAGVAAKLESYFSWAKSDPKVVGLVSPATVGPSHLATAVLSDADPCGRQLPWHYNTRDTHKDGVGLAQMPQSLAVAKGIGKAIVAGSAAQHGALPELVAGLKHDDRTGPISRANPELRQAAKPHIFWATDDVAPGETVMLAGGPFTNRSRVLLDGQPIPVAGFSSNAIMATLPSSAAPGPHSVAVEDESGPSNSLDINGPDVWWCLGDGASGLEVAAGGAVRCFGRGLRGDRATEKQEGRPRRASGSPGATEREARPDRRGCTGAA